MPTPELADTSEEWPVADSVDLHRDDWVMALRADRIRRPDHPEDEPFKRLVLEHPGAVIVLAVDDDQRVFCLWQYRHPVRRRLVELPAGLCDADGEEPLAVARRELREEAGLAASEWTPLGAMYSSPGITTELMHFFLARGLTEVDHDFEWEHEEAEMQSGWVAYDDLLARVLDGRLTDGPLVTAVLLARARGLVGP
jgi:ADP-ribose pyrophosphatase